MEPLCAPASRVAKKPLNIKDDTGMTKTKKTVVPLADLTDDARFQSRTRTDTGTVDDYKESMSSGAVMPPITVALVDGVMFIVDGWHRVQAARELGYEEIEAEVTPMTENEAMWRAAGANQSHGLRRSNADKIRAVEMVLTIPTTEHMSDREIARRIGVSHEFVRQHRMRDEENAEVDEVEDTDEETTEGVDGEESVENAAEEPMEEAKRKYAEIVGMIDAVRAALTVLSSDPAGYSVNWNAIDADIRNAKRCLTDAMPHGLCVYCNGDGCDACKHTGWLGKVAIEMAPKNLKKGRK